MKNSLDTRKIARSKSAKDMSAVDFNKLYNSKRNVFNACIGRPFEEVNNLVLLILHEPCYGTD